MDYDVHATGGHPLARHVRHGHVFRDFYFPVPSSTRDSQFRAGSATIGLIICLTHTKITSWSMRCFDHKAGDFFTRMANIKNAKYIKEYTESRLGSNSVWCRYSPSHNLIILQSTLPTLSASQCPIDWRWILKPRLSTRRSNRRRSPFPTTFYTFIHVATSKWRWKKKTWNHWPSFWHPDRCSIYRRQIAATAVISRANSPM